LYLDQLTGLDRESGIFWIRDERREGCDMRTGRDGRGCSNALGDLFAFVDFGDLFVKEFVAFLTDV
jgi:hypothetical protein